MVLHLHGSVDVLLEKKKNRKKGNYDCFIPSIHQGALEYVENIGHECYLITLISVQLRELKGFCN